MTGTNFSKSILGGYLFQRGVCEIELTHCIHTQGGVANGKIRDSLRRRDPS